MPVKTVLQAKEKAIKKFAVILWFWLPVILWMTVIFSLSAISAENMPEFDVPHIDKLFHFVEYFILGVLLVRAFFNSSQKKPDFTFVILASILIGSLYGATDEFHQRFVPGRSFDLLDLLSDIIGLSIGAGLCQYKERISRAVDKAV